MTRKGPRPFIFILSNKTLNCLFVSCLSLFAVTWLVFPPVFVAPQPLRLRACLCVLFAGGRAVICKGRGVYFFSVCGLFYFSLFSGVSLPAASCELLPCVFPSCCVNLVVFYVHFLCVFSCICMSLRDAYFVLCSCLCSFFFIYCK